MSCIPIYQTAPLPAPVSTWLHNFLTPVVIAARIDSPPPIEFRNTGLWGGFCQHRDFVPDGRVALSKTLLYGSKKSFAVLYLHECCHRLGASGHDALFFALLLVLYSRVDANKIFISKLAWDCSLYDLQDAPPPLWDEPRSVWLPQCVAWAVLQADSLAEADLSAEAVFALLSARHAAWLSTLKTSDEILRRTAAEADSKKCMRQSIFIRTFVALLGWTGFLLTSILFVRYAIANH